MNEQYELGEAKFFLERMEESIGDHLAFRYNLSAFLSAARSVLQYALEESKRKGRFQWWKDTVPKSGILTYLGTKRNVNVHREDPVDPSRHVNIPITESVGVFSVASEAFFNDKPIEMNRPKLEPPPEPPVRRQEISIQYRFDDWSGPEDVIGLSHRYIEALEGFVQSGMKAGILSG